MRLYLKLYLVLLALLLPAMAVLAVVVSLREGGRSLRELRGQQLIHARLAAAQVEAGYHQGTWPFEMLATVMEDEHVTFWQVCDGEGNAVLSNDPLAPPPRCTMSLEPPEANLEGPLLAPCPDGDWDVWVVPMRMRSGGRPWTFRLGFHHESVHRQTAGIAATNALSALAIAVVLLPLSLVMTRWVLRPLGCLTSAADRMRQGDLATRCRISGSGELVDLGRSFNTMAAALQSRERSLAQANEGLEARVAERTAELSRAHEHLRTVIDAISDPFIVIDRNRRVVLANAAARDAAGGLDPVQNHLTCHRASHRSDAPCTGEHPCPLDIVAATKRPARVVHTHYSGPEAEPRIVEVSASPVFDESGEVVQVIEALRDITERVRAEERLAIFRRFAGAAEQGFGMADLDGRVTYVNPALARMLGLSEEQCQEFLGSTFVTAYPEEVQRRIREEILPAVRRGEPWQGELWFVASDGRRVDTFESYFLVHDEQGNPLCIAAVITDITQRKRAEEALRESEAKYRVLAENQRDVVVAVGPDGTLVYCSPAVEEFGGYDPEEELGEPVIKYVATEEDRRRVLETVEAVVRSREPTTVEFLYQPKEGAPFPVEATGKPVVEDGEVVSIQAVLRDVSERKRAEEALRESERFARGTIDGLSSSLAILDADGTILSVNRAWAEFARTNDGDLSSCGEGVNYLAVCDRAEGADSEEAARFAAGIRRVLKGEHDRFALEYPCPGPRGQRWFVGRVTRFPSDGRARVVVAHENITDRKQAEEALREEKDKLAKITSSARDAIIMMDDEGKVAFWNEAAETIFGYSAEEALGRELHPLLVPERFREAYRRGFAHFRTSGEGPAVGRTTELVGRRKGGEEFPIELSMSAVRLRGAWHAVGVVRDITDRKQAEEAVAAKAEELQRSNHELEQFAYVASHDLQEPLRMVRSYCQLLARRYEGQLDDDADEFIHYAVDGAGRMQRIIEDLLQYSRVNTRGKPPKPTDSEKVLEGVLSDLEAAVEESDAEVTHDPLPAVMADEVQLGRLLRNLVGNAIKYRGEGPPRVHVSAERRNGDCLFAVRDNGIGIDPQYHDRIFVIFQRLGGRDDEAGTGIGLAVCKRIVERHGGRIWVESAEGQGSTFYFTMPAHEQEDQDDGPHRST